MIVIAFVYCVDAVWRMIWDDLRYGLAISRTGSALRAARLLGVNQTTVLRRLDALEAAVGEPLFERRRTGQTLTAAGQLAVSAAERMEAEAQALASALAAQRRTLVGSVRLTTSEVLAGRLVIPCLGAFQSLHPDVSVELVTADERLDVARGDADVALRAGSRPDGAGIVARRLPDTDWTLFCSRSYADVRGVPEDRAALRGHDVIGMEGRMAQLDGWRWLAEAAQESVIRYRSNSLVTLVSNLKAGLGLGVLPTLIGSGESELIACFPLPDIKIEMWLIVREDLKGQRHVRAFTDFLTAHIRKTLAA